MYAQHPEIAKRWMKKYGKPDKESIKKTAKKMLKKS